MYVTNFFCKIIVTVRLLLGTHSSKCLTLSRYLQRILLSHYLHKIIQILPNSFNEFKPQLLKNLGLSIFMEKIVMK